MKLDSYDWRGLPPDLIEWLEECTDIINLNQVECKFFGAPPTSATVATQGWFGIAKDGANWYMYIYSGSSDGWQKVQLAGI